jgi:hypothetical protein
MDDNFWTSRAGGWTMLGLGALGVGALTFLATTPTTPAATAINSTPATSGYFFFAVTTSYAWNQNTTTAVSQITAAITTAGFSNINVFGDPTNTSGWVGTGLWTAPPGVSTPTLASGSGTFTQLQALTTTPPSPVTYPGLNANDWYAFSCRTSFPVAATNAQSLVGALVAQVGFTNAQIATAADSNPNPNTWNVVAQWAPSNPTAPDTTTSFQDMPPVFIVIPGTLFDRGTTQPTAPAAGAAVFSS